MKPGEIGRRMAALRRRKGLTMRRIGELTGLSEGQISRLENGQQGFRSETLIRIARALGVEPFSLYLPAGWEEREAQGSEFDRVLTAALREPRFVSLLEAVAAAHRGSAAKFRRIRSVIEIMRGEAEGSRPCQPTEAARAAEKDGG